MFSMKKSRIIIFVPLIYINHHSFWLMWTSSVFNLQVCLFLCRLQILKGYSCVCCPLSPHAVSTLKWNQTDIKLICVRIILINLAKYNWTEQSSLIKTVLLFLMPLLFSWTLVYLFNAMLCDKKNILVQCLVALSENIFAPLN